MIYLDSSVALAHLLSEDRQPPDELWAAEPIVSSRLLQYETWTVLHARKLTKSHGDSLRRLLGRIAVLELESRILARALEPFPLPVRTLDALHLASMVFLDEAGQAPELATYDEKLAAAARKLKIAVRRI